MIDTKFFEAMIDGVACCRLANNPSEAKAGYQYVMVNHAFEVLSGLERRELIGELVATVTPELAKTLGMDSAATVALELQFQVVKQEHYFPGGNRWCLVYFYFRENEELVIVCNDITRWRKQQTELAKHNQALRKRNQKLRRQLAKPTSKIICGSRSEEAGSYLEKTELREEICNLLCQVSNDGLWYWDIAEDRLLLLGSWYRHLNLVDFTPDTKSQQWLDRIHPDDIETVAQVCTEYFQGNIEQCRCRYRLQNGAGEYRWVELIGKALFDPEGKPYVMAGTHTLVAQSQTQQELLEQLDYFDSLTGLPNRLMFIECLSNAVKVARRHHSKCVVVFLDLEEFGVINENYGFEFGDRLLAVVAKRVNQLTRSYENVARWEETGFAFVLQGINEISEVTGFCKRLYQAFVEPFKVKKHVLKLGIHINVAIYPEDGLEPEDLLFNMEKALTSLKTFVRDNWQFYKLVPHFDFTRKNEIRKRLRKALEQKRFTLNYQPQVELETGKIRRVEALLRWNEPGLGWVGPLEFIPFAEESGLIIPLGEWVLREACRQNMLWQKQIGLRIIMAVNVSAVQLRQAGFAAMVREVLTATGMEPQLLELEITESTMIHSFNMVAALLDELRQMGVRISLDDFGTGYAWLSYLKRLPLDTLKLDKSIIDDIHYDLRGKNIIEAIVELVRKLGLTIVAEGVEHQKQLECLRGSHCDYVQGYLLGRPLVEAELIKVIQRNWIDSANRINGR
jgi:diguanylate cyclase (GGDEF)-like protein